MKKFNKKLVASALAVGLVFSGIPFTSNAADNESNESADGYKLVWEDDFTGSSLDTSAWNVEAHDPGWVNAELQRYVSENDMADNIEVSEGKLKIYPTVEEISGASTNILSGNSFDSTNWSTLVANWESDGATADGSINIADGNAVVAINDSGTQNWHVQVKQDNLNIVQGHSYKFTMKASSTAARKIEVAINDPEDKYYTFGSSVPAIGEETGEIVIEFTAEKTTSTASLQINMGLINGSVEDSGAATITLSDVAINDLTAAESDSSEFNYKNYNYTSGRINTQGKKDFTYGKFVCRARVPEGKGYLPAFWLMASDETNYGQWPQCGEIDIMEVMGQETNKSYHTIHYGYDSGSGHRQSQGTLKVDSESDFSKEFHEYALEWLPGQLIWYVDGTEVYRENDWFTGKDAEGQLTYPAPFDQDFYVILNLAVGGSWVGYPDEAAVNDMNNQSFEIDYVKVYQKSEAEYKELEEKAEKPEKTISYREPVNGNYVVNGDFAKDIKAEGADGDNWLLHVENDASGSTATVENNAITINSSEVGGNTYSVQLKQEGIPMYKGWKYNLSFDASADLADGETRTMIVDVEGGEENGWARYLKDTTVELSNKTQSYSYDFTMDSKTYHNGILEFNLGDQGSTAPVTISNVTITHVDGEEIKESTDKTVRPDGNYVYNGTFDQGEQRLGYWEVSDEDKGSVSVTNEKVNGKTSRELTVKVVVPEGASEADPVVISQSELESFTEGKFDFSFDAYTPDGAEDGLTAIVADRFEVHPKLTSEKQNFDYTIKFDKEVSKNHSNVIFKFTKAGTYYLDNVAIRENAMIKNAKFDSNLANYEFGAYSPGEATFGVDSITEGNQNAFDATIKTVGNADWNIQLKQRGITLEKGKSYKLTFDARATVDRTISVVMQRDGAADDNWAVYSGGNNVALTGDWQTFELEFEMNDETDTDSLFSVSLGKFDDIEADVAHHVFIDNISLEDLSGSEGSSEGTDSNDVIDLGEPSDPDPDTTTQDPANTTQKPAASTAKTTQKQTNPAVKATPAKKSTGTKTSTPKASVTYKNEWVNGVWYNGSGKVDYLYKATWKYGKKGWYFEDSSKWYAKNQWQKIDNKWYYFDSEGYMAYNEYRDGCWLGSDGAWVEAYSGGHWEKTRGKWWYTDNTGWYASNQYVWIDGIKYKFNKKGYLSNK